MASEQTHLHPGRPQSRSVDHDQRPGRSPTPVATCGRRSPKWSATTSIPRYVFDDVIAGQRQDLQPEPFDTFDQLHHLLLPRGRCGRAGQHLRLGFRPAGPTPNRWPMDRGRGVPVDQHPPRPPRRRRPRPHLSAGRRPDRPPNVTEDRICGATRGEGRLRQPDAVPDQPGRGVLPAGSRPLESRIEPDSRPTLVAMTRDLPPAVEKGSPSNPERVLRERVSLSLVSKLMIGWRAARSR